MPSESAGKWDYSGVDDVCYSDINQESYKKAIAFLDDGIPIEDWGGGTGWARKFVVSSSYRNIDGSPHPNVDEVVDLATYKSSGYNILLRQVLGCAGSEWKKILRNAVQSFENKLCIVIGTPLVETTQEGNQEPVVLADGTETGEYIQEYYFKKEDIINNFSDFNITEEIINTNQYYGQDWIIYVERI